MVSALAALILLPQTDMAKTFLLKQARKYLGNDLQIEHMNLAILPTPHLRLSNVKVKNVHPTLESFSAQSLEVEVSALPLLARTIVLTRLVIHDPQVIVNLSQEESTVSDVPVPGSDHPAISSQPSSPLPLPFIEQLHIQKGRLTLRKMDERQRAKELRIEDIQISSDASSLPASLQLSAKTVDNKKTELKVGFSGLLESLAPQNSVHGHLWGNLPTIQLVGDAEVSNLDLAAFEEIFEFGAGLEEFQHPINFKTHLTLFPDSSGIILVFSGLEGNLGELPIRGKGSLSGIMGHELTYYTSVSSSPISVQTLRSLLPSSILPMDLQKRLDDHNVEGKIELVNSTVAGSSSDGIGTSIREEIRISQGHALFDKNLPPLKHLSGTLIWDNGELRVNDLAGQYRSTQMTDGQANIRFHDSGPWIALQLSSHINVQDLLHAWSTIANHEAVPATLKNLQGSGKVSLRIHGPLQEPNNMVIESIHLDEGHFSVFPELPTIHHVSGTLNVMNDRLIVQGLKAQHGSSKILDAKASVQFQAQGPWAQVEGKTIFYLEDIKKLFEYLEPTNELPKTLKTLEGNGNLSFKLHGPLQEWQNVVIEKAQLDEGELHIHPNLQPIQPLTGTASYKNGSLTIQDFTAAYRSSQIGRLSGTVRLAGPNPEVAMNIHSTFEANDIVGLIQHIDPIPEALRPVAKFEEVAGSGRIQANLQGPLDNPAQIRINSGEAHLLDIRFHTPYLPEPIKKLNGRLLISEEALTIQEISGQIGKSGARLQGTIGLGETKTFRDVVLNGYVETIDIEKMLPEIVAEALEGTIRVKAVISGNHDFPDYTVHANLNDVQLDVPDVIHKPAGMPASFQSGGKVQNQRIVIVDHAELDLPQLELFGKGTFTTGDEFGIKAALEAAPLSLASLPEKLLFGIEKFKSGDVSLALDVDGTGKDWRGWKINGAARLNDIATVSDSPDEPMGNASIDLKLNRGNDELNFQVEAIPLKNIAALGGIADPPVNGDLWANGVLKGRIEPNRDPIPTLEGKVDLLVKDGLIYPGPVMANVIAILNLPTLLKKDVTLKKDTLPFTSISGEINIQKGILHTENLILNSPELLISTMGEQDLPAEQMDLVIAASPLGPYTNILKNLPLVNRLFGKGDTQLLTVFFEVKGPSQNPTVRPLPFKSVKANAKGLVDLGLNALKDTAKLPNEVLQSLPGEKEPLPPKEEIDAPEKAND